MTLVCAGDADQVPAEARAACDCYRALAGGDLQPPVIGQLQAVRIEEPPDGDAYQLAVDVADVSLVEEVAELLQ
jgi:hypothetical protein